VSFIDRQLDVHWSCYIIYILLFTEFVNFGQSRLSGLSLGAFINSTRCVGSFIPAVLQLVSYRNRFDSLPVYRTS